MQPPCIQNGVTPLYEASINGHRDLAELLLANKAGVNLQDNVTRGEGWGVAPMVVGADACIVGVWCYGALVLWCGFSDLVELCVCVWGGVKVRVSVMVGVGFVTDQ